MCLRENISYIEIRLVFWFPYALLSLKSGFPIPTRRPDSSTMARANGKEDFSHAEWMTAFAEELASFKDGLAAKGLSHKFVGSRVST